MKNQVTKLNEADFITSNWSGGTTTELFIYPKNSNYKERNFKVRISSATVEREESEFTRLEGIQRFITPLDSILQLSHNNKHIVNLEPFEIYEFDGGLDTKSFGKATDFNLMLANNAKGDLKGLLIPKNDSMTIQTINGLTILYSYNALFKIQFDKEEINLSPNEVLIIKSETIQPIQIHSNKDANILLSQVFY